MTLLGKALGGGIAPLAAVIANAKLDTAPELNLGYFTHERNAVSAAAGLATLSVLVDENLPARARELGALVGERLRSIYQVRTPAVVNVRSIGLMFAVDFGQSSDGRQGTELARDAYFAMLRKGLMAMPPKGNTLSFSPPLTIEEGDLLNALAIIDSTIEELNR